MSPEEREMLAKPAERVIPEGGSGSGKQTFTGFRNKEVVGHLGQQACVSRTEQS
jgi:hypothetical protein